MSYSIIVMSCDKYSDLLIPFEKCFKKYWSSCKASLYLVTENKRFDSDLFVQNILCGSGTTWTGRLRYALKQINTEWIMMLCDDYLLCDSVQEEVIEYYFQMAKKYGIGNLRLLPNPNNYEGCELGDDLGEYRVGVEYRVATQVGIWKRDFLYSLADMEDSIWGFERNGSMMSNDIEERMLCVKKHVFPFEDAVHKGKWEAAAVRLCERNDIKIDYSCRPLMNDYDYFKKYLKGSIYSICPVVVNGAMRTMSRIKSKIYR